MSDPSDLRALVTLKIEGPNPASELAVYDNSFKLVKSGIGKIDALLPRGLYDLEASIANQRERKSVALRGPVSIDAGAWDLKVRTASPRSGALPAGTLHEQMAQQHSLVPTMTAAAHGGDCRVFVFLRTVRRDATGQLQKPEQRFWSGLKLRTANGDLICSFDESTVQSELDGGWCALTVDLAVGGYVLSGPGTDGKEFCIPLWLHPGFETQLFVPVEDSRPIFDEMALAMAPKTAGFDPNKQGQTDFAAALLAGFRRGDNPVNPELVRAILDNKLYDPFAGIVAAHGLLRMTKPDTALLHDLTAELRALLGDHPDVVALELMATPPNTAAVLRFPPSLRLGLDGVLTRSASNSEIIDVNTVMSEMLGGLLTGQYVLWQRDAGSKASVVQLVKDGFWAVVSFAPGALKLFKRDDKRMVRIDLDALVSALEDWLNKQDQSTLAIQLGLPVTIISKAIDSLQALLPDVHRVARGPLKDLELPSTFGDINGMALAGLAYLVRAAGATKLSPLHKRVIQLLIQCWQASAGSIANSVRETAQYQRRLFALASAAFQASQLLAPNSPQHKDALIIASILSGLAARLYPFLLVGHELEIIVATGSLAAAVPQGGKILGQASGTIFGSAFEETLKKNLHGGLLSSARAEDFTPITIHEGGIAMDFMRVQENYWAAAIDPASSQLPNVLGIASPGQDAINHQFVDLAAGIDDDCVGFVELVRVAIDPLTPTREALEQLAKQVSPLSQKLQQRISNDVVRTPAAPA
jgi:hypothetical protein